MISLSSSAAPTDLDVMYRLLVHSIPDHAIYMLDKDGIVVSWNLGAERAKGYSAAEIIGKHFSRFYPEADRKAGRPKAALDAALTKGKYEGEGWRVRKDGTQFWAHVFIDPVRDDAGRHIGFAKVTRDISDKRLARGQERVFRLLVQGVTDYAIFLLNPDGTVANWNTGAERAKGYAAEEIIGEHFSRFYTEEDRRMGRPQRALATAFASGKFEGEGWRVRKDGTRFWAHVVIDPIYDEDGKLLGFAKIIRDLSEQKQQADRLQEIKNNLDLALNYMSQGLVLFDAQERVVLCNERWRNMLGLPEETLRPGATLTDILWEMYTSQSLPAEEIARKVQKAHRWLTQAIQSGKSSIIPDFAWRGRSFSVSQNVLPNGRGWVTTLEDITERRVTENKLTHLAQHDVLTELPNRMNFRARLARSLQDTPDTTAVLYVDLDRFKPVNDMFGHSFGDAVLKIVAERMQAQLRRHDIVARLGGDEFAVLLGDHATRQDAQALAKRLLREVSLPIEVEGRRVNVGASIGIAMAPDHGDDPELLLRNADLALYRAKGMGGGRHRFYEAGMELLLQQRRELEHDLRNALTNGECRLHYQPVVNRRNGVLAGFEALMRWTSPTRGEVSPADFIPISEDMGIMSEIGEWVLRNACREALNWPREVQVSVNLSPTQFAMPDLVERIAEILAEIGLPPERLELEITETAMIGDVPAAGATLARLRALGIHIAMDDFGTGYSSLSFLRAMPFTRIKIDRSFVQDLGTKPEAAAIIRAVVGMGEGIGVAVTAEGVETARQAETLDRLGCWTLQGFFISHPLPAADIPAWIETHHAARRAS